MVMDDVAGNVVNSVFDDGRGDSAVAVDVRGLL